MKLILLFLLLAGCAVPEPPAASAPPRDCPTLPTLKPGAGQADMLTHIRVTADLYARCAATP
ncbi:hypothetical protein [Cupriavidus sp. Agwp_2]|uniref:hypothetical protein n=1 Tax=Cupriavidus sp. Agwp_2 TaxID=2897324 RepID=UPI00345FCD18